MTCVEERRQEAHDWLPIKGVLFCRLVRTESRKNTLNTLGLEPDEWRTLDMAG